MTTVDARDIDCEPVQRALIGCLLHLPAAEVREVTARLTLEHFTPGWAQLTYAAATQLADQDIQPHPAAVLGQLRRTGEAVSWSYDQRCPTLLAEMYGDAPIPSQAGWYVGILHDHLVRRRVQQMAVRLGDAAGTLPVDRLLELVDEQVRRLPRAR